MAINLKCRLPEQATEALALTLGEEIQFAAEIDLSFSGELTTDSFVVVTSRRLAVLSDGELVYDFILTETDFVKCEPEADCGLLVVSKNGREIPVARFTKRQTIRFSYIARGADLIAKGRPVNMKIREREKTCKKCGKPLPGNGMCRDCGGKKDAARRLWELLRPYFGRLLLVSGMMLFSSGLVLFTQYLNRILADKYLLPKNADVRQLALVFTGMTAAVALSIFFDIFQNHISVRLGSLISLELREKLYAKLQELSLSFVSTRHPGELMNRISRDTGEIRRFFEELFSGMFSTLITMVGALLVMIALSPGLTLLSLIFVPPVFIISRLWRKRIHRIFHAQWKKTDRLSSRLQDVLSGIRVVKSFGREESEIALFKERAEDLGDTQKKNELFWANFYPFLTFLMGLGTYFVMLYGGIQVLNLTLTPGEFMQFTSAAGMLYGPLNWMSRFPRMLIRMLSSLTRIYDVMDEEPEIVNSPKPHTAEIKGDVELRNVRFGYRSYEPVLEDISFKVNAGEMIGLVGPSGAGKSTIINLIMRLYDVDEGGIYIDGKNIREYDSQCLHNQIGVVLQETFLFSGSIYDNIRFSKPDATREEIITAARHANAHDFICKFPDGYDSYVGERGIMLSGGERQRIAIARAILNSPRILILDEATSSLDTESEHEVQKALTRLTEGRTTFAIAHRLSTLKNASRLFVIDDHSLAEHGTHEELLAKKGIYYSLVQAQLEMHKVQDFDELEKIAKKEVEKLPRGEREPARGRR